MADGRQLSISESAQLQIAQMCSQDMPPGTTLVMTQAEVPGSHEGGSIVMRVTADGNGLEQVETESVQIHEGFVEESATQQHEQYVTDDAAGDSQDNTVPRVVTATEEDQRSTDILVEIQQDDSLDHHQVHTQQHQVQQGFHEQIRQQQQHKQYAAEQVVVEQSRTEAAESQEETNEGGTVLLEDQTQNSTDILVEIQ